MGLCTGAHSAPSGVPLRVHAHTAGRGRRRRRALMAMSVISALATAPDRCLVGPV